MNPSEPAAREVAADHSQPQWDGQGMQSSPIG
jgi:hypothetical protein